MHQPEGQALCSSCGSSKSQSWTVSLTRCWLARIDIFLLNYSWNQYLSERTGTFWQNRILHFFKMKIFWLAMSFRWFFTEIHLLPSPAWQVGKICRLLLPSIWSDILISSADTSSDWLVQEEGVKQNISSYSEVLGHCWNQCFSFYFDRQLLEPQTLSANQSKISSHLSLVCVQ